ncbi:unnamed protein product [Absidia cylindrospora]
MNPNNDNLPMRKSKISFDWPRISRSTKITDKQPYPKKYWTTWKQLRQKTATTSPNDSSGNSSNTTVVNGLAVEPPTSNSSLNSNEQPSKPTNWCSKNTRMPNESDKQQRQPLSSMKTLPLCSTHLTTQTLNNNYHRYKKNAGNWRSLGIARENRWTTRPDQLQPRLSNYPHLSSTWKTKTTTTKTGHSHQNTSKNSMKLDSKTVYSKTQHLDEAMDMEVDQITDISNKEVAVNTMDNNNNAITNNKAIFLADLVSTNNSNDPTIHSTNPPHNLRLPRINSRKINQHGPARSTTLCNADGRDSSRWETEKLCKLLAAYYQSQLAFIGSGRRFSDPMDKPPYTLAFNKISLHDNDTCGGKQGQTDFGLQTYQHLHPMLTFQDGRRAGTQGTHSTERLYLQTRSQRCVRSGSDSPAFSTIPIFSAPRRHLSIQDTSFWNECGPSGILQVDAICNCTVTGTRDSLGVLFGRHLFTGKINNRNGNDFITSLNTFGKTGLHHQQEEKRSRTEEDSGILGFPIQQLDDDDQGSGQEDGEIGQSFETGDQRQILQVDGSIIGENHQHDSSDWGRTLTYPFYPEGPRTKSSPSTLVMGKTVPALNLSNGRSELVEVISNNEEWDGDQETTTSAGDGQHLRGRLGLGLGNQIRNHSDGRFLVNTRKRFLDQCSGVENHLICNTTTQKRIRQPTCQPLQRQHDRAEVCQEEWGTASTILQSLALEINSIMTNHQLTISFQHIAGKDNVIADQLSRIRTPTYEWKLPKHQLHQLCRHWNFKPRIDAFASRINNRLPMFWSQYPDPQAAATDAFRQIWPRTGLYLHPPWKLIPRVLDMIKIHKVKAAILITPYWPMQHWWPLVMELALDKPQEIFLTKHKILAGWLLSNRNTKKVDWRRTQHNIY